MKAKSQLSERSERRVISRKCVLPGQCIGIAGRRYTKVFTLKDVMVPTTCSIIPDIRLDLTVAYYDVTQSVIDNYIISDCRNPCPKTITLSAGTIFDGAQALNGTISLDPPINCCQIDRAQWESITQHIAIGGENDPTGWRRICYIINNEFPNFIPVTPLGLVTYSLGVISGNATVTIGDYEAFIAEDPTNSYCAFYVEIQEMRLEMRDPDVLICGKETLSSIGMVWFSSICFCIGERVREEPPREEIPANTKEDAEVLLGLNIGAWTYEQLWDTHILRQNKIR